MTLGHPILQFGTSRFLQAHADLFVSEAMDRGEALGGITVVQTTGSAQSSARTEALAHGDGYEVHVRGLRDGAAVDEVQRCRSVKAALHASHQWAIVRNEVTCGAVQVIVSNTGDSGWVLSDADSPSALAAAAIAPASFPAKLLVLLHDHWLAWHGKPLSVLPCELVSRNGDGLRDIVTGLAQRWQLPIDFIAHLREEVRWANSLVDRIVSEALHPVGAVAEPYALWAVERQQGLVLPCRHPSIVLTDDLTRFERLKLHLLNLGHTWLAEMWLRAGSPQGMTVLQAMRDPAMAGELEAVWTDEVLPVFDDWTLGDEAREYLVALRDRLRNPFLAHLLSDIAQNHAQKKQRRFAPVVAHARARLPQLAQPRLRAALESTTQGATLQ
jgi:tagaturonate reductase